MVDKLLICTDLDRTLIPNGEEPESLNARQLFSKLVSDCLVTLAYVTGRDRVLVKKAIAQYQLPLPNFVIADVGSTIYEIQPNNQWLRLQDWDTKLAISWQHKTQADLVPLFVDLKQCRLQEIEKQGLHKLSYYVSLETDRETIIAKISSRLENQKIQANIIWSIDREAQVGLLDILPPDANKRLAIEFLMANQNFTFKNTVFSGDSGNDLDVLISPIKSILVANAAAELKAKVQAEVDKIGLTDSLYIAQGNYLDLNGNYSAGIMEGIAHYFPEVKI
ncbi:MAG: HAD-IIB family hydrolase [Gomphosphaeria aponina SAG 52.96 = DSM 107014]|uniref:HAD-IIB family hydrolase n=1 Tax=Gomphosphaeria aponina SAG 52.96 = DSM 107014 TaxID=1521640 RepID=A0A941GME8_9CHRO|nr:HAD-IIB family hydrolase [Gomphosphaeria aponina SAG 52.96 = DSM 107014]